MQPRRGVRRCAEPNHDTLEGVLSGKSNLDASRQPIAAMSPLSFPLYAQKAADVGPL